MKIALFKTKVGSLVELLYSRYLGICVGYNSNLSMHMVIVYDGSQNII